jgi:hypothetical protein
MKYLLFLMLCLILYGCPSYDPQTAVLTVYNLSDSAVYVYKTCENSIEILPRLKLFEVSGAIMEDEKGNQIDSIYSPNYRVNAYNSSEFSGFGNIDNPTIFCNNSDYINLFFIKETTIKNYSWEEIVEKQIYVKKMRFNCKQLDSLNWKVKYIP